MDKKIFVVVRNVILAFVSIAILFSGVSFLYLKWKNTHGWVINITSNSNNKREVLDSLKVVDSNVKSAMLRAEEYIELRKWNHEDVEIEVVKYIGREPWKRFGIYPVAKNQ